VGIVNLAAYAEPNTGSSLTARISNVTPADPLVIHQHNPVAIVIKWHGRLGHHDRPGLLRCDVVFMTAFV